jgi:mono/diheme cytochrome c family protein
MTINAPALDSTNRDIAPRDFTVEQLLRMSQQQLDDLFTASPPGEIPDGEAEGVAIVWPGTLRARCVAWFARWFLWQGKVVNRAGGCLVNRISVISLKCIKANVYKAPSWMDEKECIVLDYSKTSFVAKKVRDEIRLVGDRVYLGKVFWGKKRTVDFALDFKKSRAARKIVSWPRLFLALFALLAIYGLWRFNRNAPVTYRDPEEHFKYGSTGGETLSGIPVAIWKALPTLFPDKLPGQGYPVGKEYAAFGFIYEDGHDLPIGTSKRNVQGIDRVFLNCAVCHAGTVRATPQDAHKVYLGMGANTIDLGAFQKFLIACARDERFTPDRLLAQISAQQGNHLDAINRAALRYYGIFAMRDRLLDVGHLFAFVDREPPFGPGRFDTFNPPKALLNFPMDEVPQSEWVGVCDFPSIWNQGPRQGMRLHWDGNNDSVQERNRSAAFGTGAFPPSLDRKSMKRIEDWLMTRKPDPFPFAVNTELAAKGKPLYETYCASCHGKSGSDFTGEYVGKVTPIAAIATDRHRLDSYSEELSAAQNTLYAGYDNERFSHFRKTHGYANAPLDGVWLRAPYLHNGSVPTLRDLLEPAANRPKVFYRGYDVYDAKRVGFVSDVPAENGRPFFHYDTTVVLDKNGNNVNAGNGNAGHEGKTYGTDLAADEKDAIVEYLKQF